ncbi:MAG: DegV family protein [Anaerolineales bacterium]|nr:DegV family protein [Anaerolineales bacterium]
MQIVTDSGADLFISEAEKTELNIHVVPLVVSLDGKTYREGVDIQADDFYRLLDSTESFPTTSQPSAGDFSEVYQRLAAFDPDILSIHMSSGLSGTYNAARAGAEMVPEASVTHVDTKTLSAAAGWQVVNAARAIQAGWTKERVLDLVAKISSASDSLYTLRELKYLIHGGRISHMKGLIASILKIKPLIGVETVNGTYVQMGQARTFQRAVQGLVDLVAKKHEPGSSLLVQVLHSNDPKAANMLHDLIDKVFDCTWLPMGPMSLVLGAHTGPGMVGVAFAPLSTFAEMV